MEGKFKEEICVIEQKLGHVIKKKIREELKKQEQRLPGALVDTTKKKFKDIREPKIVQRMPVVTKPCIKSSPYNGKTS